MHRATCTRYPCGAHSTYVTSTHALAPNSSFWQEQWGHQYAPYIVAPVAHRYYANVMACAALCRFTVAGTITAAPVRLFVIR